MTAEQFQALLEWIERRAYDWAVFGGDDQSTVTNYERHRLYDAFGFAVGENGRPIPLPEGEAL